MDAQTPTAMETLFSSISTNISKIMECLSSVSTSLMSNSIFQLTIGIAVLFIIFGIVFKLVRKMRKGGR